MYVLPALRLHIHVFDVLVTQQALIEFLQLRYSLLQLPDQPVFLIKHVLES